MLKCTGSYLTVEICNYVLIIWRSQQVHYYTHIYVMAQIPVNSKAIKGAMLLDNPISTERHSLCTLYSCHYNLNYNALVDSKMQIIFWTKPTTLKVAITAIQQDQPHTQCQLIHDDLDALKFYDKHTIKSSERRNVCMSVMKQVFWVSEYQICSTIEWQQYKKAQQQVWQNATKVYGTS